MKNLIRRIENLLAEHDCVIVPGLGGFVQNERAAYHDEENACFYPAGKQIGFNAKLNFNDGLLAQSYQQDLQISFEQANEQIAQAVTGMKSLLNQGKSLSLGQIGFLSKNEQDVLIFKSTDCNTIHPEHYGLSAFRAISKVVVNVPKNVSKEVRLSDTTATVSGNFGKWAIAVAACLLFMLLFSPRTAVNDGYQRNEASIVDPIYSVMTDSNLPSLSAPQEQAPIQDSLQQPSYLQTSQQPFTSSQANSLSGKQSIQRAHKQSHRQYLIVIASFATEAEAEQYIQTRKLDRLFPNIGIAVGEERSRIYVDRFEDKEEALFFLSEFRESHSKYAKSWVLSL